MTRLIHFFKDESGAAAAEYALILAIVGAAIAVAALTLGSAIANAMNGATACINNATSTNCN
jgi:pilus assembly protein Flp/PilA